jgi:dephospho-CoA kinase
MLLVGLTGGIASGKSLVSRVFKEMGAHIIDADRIVHELLAPGEPAWNQVVEHFGEQVLLPDRCIDRRKLGEVVFRDEKMRTWLNRCIHPLVFDVYQARVRRLRKEARDAVVVFDAALLIETGYHKKMDRVVVVYAEPEQQLKRLIERDRFTDAEALARIGSQMPLGEKRTHADYVIENTDDREATERQARAVFAELKREAEKAK